MDRNELKYWIALKWIDGLGNIGFKHLLEALGSPCDVFRASPQTLKAIPGIGQKIVDRITGFHDWQKIEKEMDTATRLNVSIVTCHNSLYPRALLHVYDYPAYLYVKGTLSEADINIAVVGSRIASTYGKFSTGKLCRELAIRGITVVSGMARGIDSAAHTGALAGKGRTIAVLGCGLDIIYPPENEKLFHSIASSGAIITEFPFSTPPNGLNFPARNRIISGISLGVVVVEATDKSGSLITARLALEQNREVFAVPGSIDLPGSKGTNKLIKQGAKLVERVEDILDEIISQVEKGQRLPLSPPLFTGRSRDAAARGEREQVAQTGLNELNDMEKSVLQCITTEPVDIDGVIEKTKLKPQEVLHVVLTLELRSLIKQLPGKKFIRME